MEKGKYQKGVKIDVEKLMKVYEQSGAKTKTEFCEKARINRETLRLAKRDGILVRATLDKIELAYGLPEGYLDLKDEPPKAEADTTNIMNVLLSALNEQNDTLKAILARLNSIPSREYIGEEVSNLIGALEDVRTPIAAIRKEIAPKEGRQ